jgi:CheY-like chemotaxis protein
VAVVSWRTGNTLVEWRFDVGSAHNLYGTAEEALGFRYGQPTVSEMTANPDTRKEKRALLAKAGSERIAVKGKATVLVVDDDPSVLSALARLIRASGYRVRPFSRPDLLLMNQIPRRNACVVADIFLSEMNGIELCDTLARCGTELPYILITGRNDATALRLSEKSRALAVLFKPVDEVPLLKLIARAVAISKGNARKK